MADTATISPAARRYAQAAFEIANGQGNVDQWIGALEQIAAFMGEADIRRALENPRYSPETKQKLVEAGLAELPPLPLNLARLLVRKGRTPIADGVLEAFRELANAQRHISRVRAQTAVPLSDAERLALVERLRQVTGGEVQLETDVDPGLLGGVVVQIGDRMVDASTRARLAALRESLIGAI